MGNLQIIFVGDVLMEEGKNEEARKLYALSKESSLGIKARLINALTETNIEEATKLFGEEVSSFEKPVLESEEQLQQFIEIAMPDQKEKKSKSAKPIKA